jgi:Tfp pilus assembly protein PilO
MSSTRNWAVGTAVVSILLIVASWFLLIGPKRSEAADLKTQKVSQDSKNAQLQLDISQLKAQYATLPAKQAELEVIKRQLPDNPALPTMIRSLTSIATASGATLFEVSPGQPIKATVTAPTTTGATTTGTTGTTGTTTGTGASTGASATNLVRIPLAVTVHGTYAECELFLQKLQTGMTRALLVDQLSVKPFSDSSSGAATPSTAGSAASGESLEMVVTGAVFVLPDPPSVGATTGSVANGTTTGATSTGSAS